MRESQSGAESFVAVALIVMLLVGYGLRAHNLGRLGLVADEGHQAVAVGGILNHGYPLVPSGSVYTRSLLFLYIQSISAYLFGLNEFALRLPGVLFNVATIIMIYFFGRTLFDARVGLLSAAIITLSAWEIELSRYARMYTGFQFFYLLSLFIFYKGFIRGERIYRILVIPSFFITFIFHDIGVILLTAFAVPFVLPSYRIVAKRTLFIYMIILTAGFWSYKKSLVYMFPKVPSSFTKTGTPNTMHSFSLLDRALNIIKDNFRLPEIGLLKQLWIQHLDIFLLICAGLALTCGYLFWKAFANPAERWENGLAMPIVFALFLYQFTLAFCLFGLYLLIVHRPGKSFLDTPSILIYLAAFSTFLFWFSYASLYPVSPYFSLAEAFFGFPDIYDYFLKWFIEDWPKFITVASIGMVFMFHHYFKAKEGEVYLFSIVTILLPLMLASIIAEPFYDARYAFHLYPSLIIIFSFVIIQVTNSVVPAAAALVGEVRKNGRIRRMAEVGMAVILAVVLCQDINPSDALAIGYRTYQSTKDNVKGPINWKPYAEYHQAYKTAAEFVKTHMQAGDIVLVSGAPHVGPIYYYYLGKVDYVLLEAHNNKETQFRKYINGKMVHYTIGAVILSDGASLDVMVKKSRGRRIWFLTDRYLLANYYSPEMRQAMAKMVRGPQFVGDDGKTLVFLIDHDKIALQPRR
jgi:Dolichyl-phosphate-mannose-protein mannosyltransferase